MITAAFRRFFRAESTGGIALVVAALLALAVSNSPWGTHYRAFVQIPGELRIGDDWLVLSKTLTQWINELWMAVFFFLFGLEIKRELIAGELAMPRQALLPIGAALGGMLMPALIYALINRADPVAMQGWAIPVGTDLAFGLGILLLLGSRVPNSLKIFLTAVAIINALGAMVVIALFYTQQLALPALGLAFLACGILLTLNRMRVMNIGLYLLVGFIVWVCLVKSGVHATLAGVATAFAIPWRNPKGNSPLEVAENALHPWVAFLILPLFAFTNAGVDIKDFTSSTSTLNIATGIACALVLGKALGVFGASWLVVRFTGATWPDGANRVQFLGVCALCGIGFTMSLFIGALAVEGLAKDFDTQVKLGVISGSLISAALGLIFFLSAERRSNPNRHLAQET